METWQVSSIDMGLRKKAAALSFLVSVVVFSIKLYAYHLTLSTAILSDALESVVNIVAALVAVVVIRYVSEPADKEHPYGHGKVEYFSAAFEGGLIVFAALMIAYQSIMALVKGHTLNQLDDGLVLVVIATVFNFGLSLYLKRVSQVQKSEALAASGAHLMSDVVTTAGIVLGLGLVIITKWYWIDPLLAIGVSFHLIWEGSKIVRRSISGLIDEVDVSSLRSLSESFSRNRREGIINIHNLKTIRSGSFHHVDAHLVVPEFWNIATVHELTEEFERAVVQDYPFDGEIAFHLDPCLKKYCQMCELGSCPVRVEKFVKAQNFVPEELINGPGE
jgi:cation diffusion facilitator family transporter